MFMDRIRLPEMRLVTSTSIKAVGYDNVYSRLVIEFINGDGLYCYEQVPPKAYVALCNADSMGRHYHTHIKSKFASRKIYPDDILTNVDLEQALDRYTQDLLKTARYTGIDF